MEWMETPKARDVSQSLTGFGYLGRQASYDNVPPPDTKSAQAFWVELNADSEALAPHFHRVPQFQFTTLGDGTIGRSRLAPGVVQYADAATPYGPIRPGRDGLAFLTLRSANDSGAFFMPDSRDHLQTMLGTIEEPKLRRNFAVDLNRSVDPDNGGPAGRSDWADMRSDADGLRIAVRDLGADEQWSTPAICGSGGYIIVVRGSLRVGRQEPRSGDFVRREPGMPTALVAGSGGARVALLQLPICSASLTSLS